jgi:2-methylcitrate dehydratase PrpD
MQAIPLHAAVLDSDLKMLTAAAPVRMALDACAAAGAGLSGTADILGRPEGLLAHLSAIQLPEALVTGLGRRWHTDTLTIKRFPGSAYSMAAWDCAQRLHRRIGVVEPDTVRRIVIHGSLLTWLLDTKVRGYLRGGDTSVTAATFSTGYGVATLLRTGDLLARDFTAPALADPARWNLASKVAVEHDPELSEQMLEATSPLGETLRLAGHRAAAWPDLAAWAGDDIIARLDELGPPADTFDDATMTIGARMSIEFTDGGTLTEECRRPIGMSGPATHRDHQAIVREKFLRTGGAPAVLADLERLDSLDSASVRRVLSDALESDASEA